MKTKKFIYIILAILPFIDLVTSLQARISPGTFSIGMIIKGIIIFLASVYILFFSMSKYKKISLFYMFLTGIFIITYFLLKPELFSSQFLFNELKYLFRIIYLPVLFTFFLNYFDEYGFDKNAFIRCMSLILVEFTILLLVPLVLDIAFESYTTGLHGYVGWFYAANEVSVIMIILLPFIYYFLNAKAKYNFFIALPILYVISSVGTKVTFIGALCVTILGFIFMLFKYKLKVNNYTVGAFFILVFTILFFVFVQDIAITNIHILADRQDFEFIETPTEGKIEGDASDNFENNEVLLEEPNSLISKVLKFLLSSRDIYYLQTKDIYNATFQTDYIVAGMGFSNTNKINNINIDKLIEIDYLDLYFHTGIFGLLIVLLPFIYTALLIIFKFFKDKLSRNNYLFIFYNSIILCMVLSAALIAGHVLFYPAVSIYLVIYLMFLLNEISVFKKKNIDDKKISILALHLNYGGIENVICNQANMLAKKYDVEIISLYNSHNDLPFKLDKKVKVTYLLNEISNRDKLKSAIKNFRIISILKEGIKALKILYLKPLFIKKAILYSDAKVIISSRKEFSKLLGRCHRKGTVTISEEHNYHNNNQKEIKRVISANKNVDYLLPASKELCEFYDLKVKPEVFYIPNCLNYYPSINKKKYNKRITAIGRLEKEKGFIDLIPVMKKIVKNDKNVVLDIYGDGSLKDTLIKEIKQKKLEKNIILKGYVPVLNIYKELLNYSLIICSSYTESFGLALLEAAAFKIPCVMFDSAKGPLEFVSDSSGAIISRRDKDLMAKKIVELLNSRERMQVLGENAYQKSLEYSFENIQEKFLNFVSDAIKKSESKEKKVMFISSSGGHLNELMQLKDVFKNYDYTLVTEKTKTTKKLKGKLKGRCKYLLFGTKHHPIPYFFGVLPLNTVLSFIYFLKYRPNFIVTTGAHTAGPICVIGKIFGAKIIFIESFANVNSKSVTGKLIYPFADLFIVQWESMLDVYPNATYGGWIY